MLYAAFDTETSGLFDYSKPADAEGQPRLASFAMILLDVDLHESDIIDVLVKPIGWVMAPEATAVHGLTNERLLRDGVDLSGVLERYASVISNGYILAGYSVAYDCKIMRGEMRRLGMPDLYETTPIFDAMQECRSFVTKQGGGRGAPKLSDCCSYLGIEQPAAHSALGDAWSVVHIMRKLRGMGRLP